MPSPRQCPVMPKSSQVEHVHHSRCRGGCHPLPAHAHSNRPNRYCALVPQSAASPYTNTIYVLLKAMNQARAAAKIGSRSLTESPDKLGVPVRLTGSVQVHDTYVASSGRHDELSSVCCEGKCVGWGRAVARQRNFLGGQRLFWRSGFSDAVYLGRTCVGHGYHASDCRRPRRRARSPRSEETSGERVVS